MEEECAGTAGVAVVSCEDEEVLGCRTRGLAQVAGELRQQARPGLSQQLRLLAGQGAVVAAAPNQPPWLVGLSRCP